MRRFASLFLSLVAIGAAPASAFAQNHDQTFDAAAAARASVQARRAAAIGDWPTVAKQLEEAYRADPSIANEFNLATAYAKTGQISLAIPLYTEVARKGQFTMATALFDRGDDQTKRPRSFTYSDEALRRIALLTNQPFPEDR